MAYTQHQQHQQYDQQPKLSHTIVKASTAVTFGGSVLVLSGLTLSGTVIGLTMATPVLVLFSPVLIPAMITAFLLFAGIMTSGGLGTAAAAIMFWMYKYVAGQRPVGADKIDSARDKVVSMGADVKEQLKGVGQSA